MLGAAFPWTSRSISHRPTHEEGSFKASPRQGSDGQAGASGLTSALPTWMDPASQGEGRGPGAEEERSSRVCRRKRHRAKRLSHQSPVTGGCLRSAGRCLRPQAPLAVGPAVTLGQERPRGPSCQLPPFPCSLTTHSTHLLSAWKDQNVTRVPAPLSL